MRLGIDQGETVILGQQERGEFLGGDAQQTDHGQVVGPGDLVDMGDGDLFDTTGQNALQGHGRGQRVGIGVDENQPALILVQQFLKLGELRIQLSKIGHDLLT